MAMIKFGSREFAASSVFIDASRIGFKDADFSLVGAFENLKEVQFVSQFLLMVYSFHELFTCCSHELLTLCS